ncbi:MAG: CCXG family PEP-CTERM protein [Bermanella sp.]
MLRICFVLCLVILFSASTHARQSCDWPFRTSVNIKENSGSNLSDYQVKLNINSSSFDSRYNWSSEGVDLRIFDSNDTSPLEFWIENWNQAAKTATVWVRFPASAPLIANANRNIFLYYGNTAATALANVPFTFVEPGIKFHTRRVTQDPSSYNDAQTIFNNGNDNNPNYGCTFITNFSNVTNGGLFGGKTNFIAYSETFFEVKAGENGNWRFRYGADFGWGGGLYVNGAPLDEKWGDDLWWANNWNNSSEILEGRINLDPGYHKLEIIGGEPGNDGGITVQFNKPGGNNSTPWTTFSTGNIDIRSRACPVAEPTVTFGAHDVCGIDLEQLTTTPANNAWAVNSTQTLSFSVNNIDAASDSANPNTRTTIVLPSAFTLVSTTGTNWNCTGANTINCDYNQPLNSAQPTSSVLTLTINADNATEGGNASITATVSGVALDSNVNNNSVTINVNFLADPGIPADCVSPQPGLLASFFDISGYPTTNINNAAAFQALVDARATQTYLMGQTILSDINKSSTSGTNGGNVFDTNNNDNFLMILEGYVYSDTRKDINYFGIDGDDAVEAQINGNVATAYYGLHGAANNPRGTGTLTPLPKGFSPLEFRLQEYTGSDAYFLYWSSDPNSGYTIIPAANYFHCAGNADIQLNSTIQVISDPINSSNFKAIPGAVIQHTVNANNVGNISTDLDSTVLVQAIDPQSTMYVGDLSAGSPVMFNDGAGNQASGLSYSFTSLASTTDSIAFSTDGNNFSYTPVADADGYDVNITHFRLTLGGTFKPTYTGITPTFNFIYQVKLD